MSVDYKSTVFLPRTSFPMRGGLPDLEPRLLARWQRLGLFERMRAQADGRPKFVLHDGPPYANGHLHIGHALNKILKDVINRSQQMLGRDANYVPGWDCHGLPIEWKIEEQYRAAGRDKDQVPVVEFRQECRDFAEHWIGVQREEFRRLGVEGDWERPYSTMAFPAEAQIVREIGKFLMNGGLYRGLRPVLWSVVEKTALADAELEYHDHKSITIHVAFPVVRAANSALAGAKVVIWTTTPWTIPGNRAIAYGPEIAYQRLTVRAVGEGARAAVGDVLIVAEALAEDFRRQAKITDAEASPLTAADLAGTICAHPLRGRGYEFDVPLYPADFVTADQGTGFVHIAPGHGADDFELGRKHRLEVTETVEADGRYARHVPLFAGAAVYTSEGKPGDANGKVIGALVEAGALLAKASLVHSYPHSWRSKAPLIFRATSQWFISMETNGLREKALSAIDATKFYPGSGQTRLRAMIEQRPDWCISRQRAWGVPIAVFVDKRTGEPLRDPKVVERIAEAFETEGADAWYASDPARFLGPGRDPADYEQVRDIVDVWFDSGSTHAFVLERNNALAWPASLYLEGSDQHRGWFHSSLLESCGTRGRAPYEGVLTHGFVLDEQGRKMSKSLGNTVAPQEVVAKHGADILRLWVVGSDYSEDLRIGPEIIKAQTDLYRRLRNTLRYLLGALDGFTEAERVPAAEMPELERWVLHRLAQIDALVRGAAEGFDFHALFQQLHQFCAVDLSAFYFDIRKDALYCDRPDAPRRRAVRTVMDEVFSRLTAWLAPILCFTAEEAWLARLGEEAEQGEASVHLRVWPETPAAWRDDALGAKWEVIRAVRRVVTGALEKERAEKRIGASLQAAPVVHATAAQIAAFAGVDPAEICITSGLRMVEGDGPAEAFRLSDVAGVAVTAGLAEGGKCERCWRVLPEVGRARHGHDRVCERCADAVGPVGRAA
jgi:isoleucyl-tRNA synthetase